MAEPRSQLLRSVVTLIVRLLLSQGASTEVTLTSGSSTLYLAAMNENYGIVNCMEMPWKCHENAMEMPWKCHIVHRLAVVVARATATNCHKSMRTYGRGCGAQPFGRAILSYAEAKGRQ